jgi:hypothetical protein
MLSNAPASTDAMEKVVCSVFKSLSFGRWTNAQIRPSHVGSAPYKYDSTNASLLHDLHQQRAKSQLIILKIAMIKENQWHLIRVVTRSIILPAHLSLRLSSRFFSSSSSGQFVEQQSTDWSSRWLESKAKGTTAFEVDQAACAHFLSIMNLYNSHSTDESVTS